MPKVLSIFFLLCSFSLFAQESAWYLDKEIKEIKIIGLEKVKARDVRPILEEFIGNPFIEEDFLLLQSKLYALDYFQEIIPRAVEFEGSRNFVQLEFTVKEREVISRIEILGANKLSSKEISENISMKRGDFISTTQLRADEQVLQELLISEGFPNGRASIRVDESVVIIEIEEGREYRVKDIVLYGVEHLKIKEILKIMETKRKTGFRKGVYQEPVFEGDKVRIVNLYRSKGFVDVDIIDTTIDRKYDEQNGREMLTISIILEEGSRVFFGGIEFRGNTILQQEELNELITFEQGDLLNEEKFKRDMNNIRNLYTSNGFIFTDLTLKTRRIGKYIYYDVLIDERDRAHVGKIIITGNEHTKDSVILREIEHGVGSVFNYRDALQTELNLLRLNYFSALDLQYPPGEADGLVDLVVAVEEADTTSFQFGLTFGASSDFPLSLLLDVTDRNFLGKGYTFSVATVLSQIQQRIETGFSTRYIGDVPITAGVSFEFNHKTNGSVTQDSTAPFFSNIPDPFTNEYVFSNDKTSYGGINYTAGEKFPGVPSSGEIEDYNLQTDYDFAVTTNSLRARSDYMSYDSYRFNLTPSIGYAFLTRAGRIIPSARFGFSFEWVDYDDSIYRPANIQTRKNRYELQWLNSLTLSLALDRRDLPFNPTDGFYIKQTLTLTGGFLGGNRSFITATTRGDYYRTLFDWKLTEEWSWKMVLALQTNFSIISSHFFYPGGGNAETEGPADNDLLQLNGFFNARGWPPVREGIATWNTFVELRMPLLERIIWWDFFLEGAGLWRSEEDLQNIKLSDMKFTVGAGIRFVLPQFPLRFYLAKRFSFDDHGKVQWQGGNLQGPDGSGAGGIDFVFSMDMDFFGN